MNVRLTDSERTQLRQWQKQRRDNEAYVKVTVLPMLDAGRPLATGAQDLGLDEATVYRYTRAFADLGLAQYLAHEQPGYRALLTSAQLAQCFATRCMTFFIFLNSGTSLIGSPRY